MKRIAILLVFCFAAVLQGAPKRAITETDLLKFKWAADPQLSPDGAQVAYVVVNVNEKGERYETALWLVASTPGAAPRQLTHGPRDSAPRWSPDGKTIAFLRGVEKDGKPQPPQIYLLPLAGGEPRALTNDATTPKGASSIAWSPSGDRIAFTATTRPDDFQPKKDGERESDVRVVTQAEYREDNDGYADPSRNTHLWVVNAEGGDKPLQLTSGDFDEFNQAWSPDGTRIYFLSTRTAESYYDAPDVNVYAVPARGGELTTVADIHGPIGAFEPSPDGKWIAFSGWESDTTRSYNESDLFVAAISGGAARNVTSSLDGDVLGGLAADQHPPRANRGPRPLWSADSKTIYVTVAAKGVSNLMRVDAASGRIEPWTRGNRETLTYTRASGRTVVLVSTPTIITDLFSVDDKGTLAQLTRVNDALFSELTLTEPEELWFDSFDGRKIQAWIQKPPDYDAAKQYPLILNIHGGPHAAYGYTFVHEFQWMAAKGYVVLYVNPRGSSSYGEEFGNVIQYKYPGDDYKDLMAGVDVLVARKLVDPKKLGVTGGSGGGVLTNWTVTQTDRFAAAVSQRSISDWASWWYTADFTMFQPMWFQKTPWQDPREFASRSAITYVDRIHTPMMFIEGESDYRTPPSAGGEALFRALKYLHRPTVMVRFPNEPHELSRSGQPWHRVERLQHIVGWFDMWLLGKKNEAYEKGLRR
ncbi:MAG: S9 family peptidase [Acidobacteria bacterium]|nr:S9 family peptidase [Acidobacteriota bacterium]MBV9476611.1 S9 family peptidase [Acidobacteriota bacterium]